ncbi:MAG: bifunctional 23S rRNA (guanine(2069)-N(7))-methyltransferase RlmK/23S rRNA (guanine(2445)-N(2))-methyltransferase RlmL [Nevskiaceae bacterium]|nr:MAG: bifunctional 23S rRNA (guanine(2069)-N(7))-methyltransferase RlmK/23S rRNA (guanine(2445)-N(2))-methyltransferase RlmL [Nevskiaceae bacterium]
MSTFPLFATCPRGVEPLLAAELGGFGATEIKERNGGVAARGDRLVAYRACLWSRLASRVLMPLTTFPLTDTDALYAGAKAVDWPELFAVTSRFAIEVAGHSPAVTHTHYAGLKVKDAIADRFRERDGERPNVDTENPDIRIHLHLHKQEATLSLDLAGDSLHRRGYRGRSVEAPLKENLAAAILIRAGWPALAAQGAPLLDPMCGSGTLVIEAAMMAADIAPGLARTRWGFEHWLDHVPKAWGELRAEAIARKSAGLAHDLPPMAGQDLEHAALKAARSNAERAGFSQRIAWRLGDATEARPFGERPGLVVVNPPYGERLGAEAEIIKLYSLFGATLKRHFRGWKVSVFTGRPDLGPRLGLRSSRQYALFNGALPCKLLNFEIAAGDVAPAPIAPEASDAAAAVAPASPWARATAAREANVAPAAAEAPTGGEDFANRLRKNLKHLGKWAKREGVDNYRLYDADLPDYAIAVDVYDTGERHVHVQEYAAPKTIDPVKAEKRLREALAQIQHILEVPGARIHYKLRKSQKGSAQYQKQDEREEFLPVREHGVQLWVNFDDYLDTGLFLDHRPMRLRLQREAAGKRFLNLFCYTGTATVHAAAGGAVQTVSVDLSNTYLEWAQRNLVLNGFHPEDRERRSSQDNTHRLLRADCLAWLREQAAKVRPPKFDLIFCDPPTFSNSKKMEGTLDTQRDHVELISLCARLLAPGGRLYFSTNRRGFKLDAAALAPLRCKDITAQTLGEDFKRPPPIHKAWLIEA